MVSQQLGNLPRRLKLIRCLHCPQQIDCQCLDRKKCFITDLERRRFLPNVVYPDPFDLGTIFSSRSNPDPGFATVSNIFNMLNSKSTLQAILFLYFQICYVYIHNMLPDPELFIRIHDTASSISVCFKIGI